MRKDSFYHGGQSVISIIVVLVMAGLLIGGLSHYLLEQIPEVPKITTKLDEEKLPGEKDTSPEEEIVPTCEDECFESGLRECSDGGYQVCGDYDEDKCLEWSSITACSPNTICRNGKCVQQRCVDGTPYGECSSNKPKYCENGILIDKSSVCGCPSALKVMGDSCVQKLGQECEILSEGIKNHSLAIDVVIIGADYSDKLDRYIEDARIAVNEFLSIEPYNQYSGIFNFYIEKENITKCVIGKAPDRCKNWETIAQNCGINYDLVVVLKYNNYERIQPLESGLGGGASVGNYIEVHQSVSTFIHEFSHTFGLADESYYTISGPNIFHSLEACGKPLCQKVCTGQFCDWPWTEVVGGTCCYQLPNWPKGEPSEYYATNEKSLIKNRPPTDKFSLEAKQYLEWTLKRINVIGYDKWKDTREHYFGYNDWLNKR